MNQIDNCALYLGFCVFFAHDYIFDLFGRKLFGQRFGCQYSDQIVDEKMVDNWLAIFLEAKIGMGLY